MSSCRPNANMSVCGAVQGINARAHGSKMQTHLYDVSVKGLWSPEDMKLHILIYAC